MLSVLHLIVVIGIRDFRHGDEGIGALIVRFTALVCMCGKVARNL